jgi:hypothetical protein
METLKTLVRSLRLPVDLYDSIDREARENGRTWGGQVRWVLQEWGKGKKTEQEKEA